MSSRNTDVALSAGPFFKVTEVGPILAFTEHRLEPSSGGNNRKHELAVLKSRCANGV